MGRGVIFEQRFEEGKKIREQGLQIPGGKSVPAEETAIAKALRQKHVWVK